MVPFGKIVDFAINYSLMIEFRKADSCRILVEFYSKMHMTSPNLLIFFYLFFRRPVRTTRRPKALVSSTTSNPDYEYEYYYEYEEYEDEDYKGMFLC